MTAYDSISLMMQGVFGICALLLTAVAVFLLIAVCGLRPRRYGPATASVLAAALLLLYAIWSISHCRSVDCRPVFFVRAVGVLPWVAVALLLLLLACAEGVLLAGLKRGRETVLTPMATKESLDALPDGICFYAPNGQPLLVNARMNRICGELFDSELLNAEDFWRHLQNGEGKASFLRTGPAVLLQTGDGSVWDVRHRKLTVDRAEVRELTACDVTTPYRLAQELDRRNQSLRRVNERLRRYSREVERTIRENEILNAKLRVHNDVGRALLMFRAYQAQPEEERRREELLLLWRHTIAVLKNEAAPEKPRTDWELLCRAARSVDVEILLDGTLPEQEETRAVVISAVHECLTNTVKHAGGDRLWLKLRSDGAVLTAELTNNGTPPKGPIRATGGLLNLRRAVERAGGTMTTEAAPRFLLRVELPEGGNRPWEK